MTDTLETIKELVVGGKFKEIEEQVQGAVDSGTDLNLLINEALISAMDIVGKRFADGDIYVPEMLVSAKTMKMGLDIIKPLLQSGEAEHRGTIAMGTVKGDLHDIGKNIVATMFRSAEFEVHDLGVDVAPFTFIVKADEVKADIIALSALLTTTLVGQKDVLEALEGQGKRDKFKVIVGGGAVTKAWSDEIGADGYAENAYGAVELAKSFTAS